MENSNIKCNTTLLTEEIISQAKTFSSTLLSDAMEGDGSLDYQIKPVTKGTFMVGTALTVDLQPGDNLYLHQAIYLADRGYVIMVDGKKHEYNAYLGELMALAAEAIGVEGIVIDGLIRDKQIVKNLEIPIFARGFIPRGPRKERQGSINKTISCGGILVQPGDLVLGDEDGVTVVPRDRIEEVFRKAESKKMYEEKRIKVIHQYRKDKEKGDLQESIKPSWLKEKIRTIQ